MPKSRFTVHPQYNNDDNDIALINLANPYDIATFPCLAGETSARNKTTGVIAHYFILMQNKKFWALDKCISKDI